MVCFAAFVETTESGFNIRLRDKYMTLLQAAFGYLKRQNLAV